MAIRFDVRRDDIRQGRWATIEAGELDAGAVRVRIDLFALTANNITYATFGDALGYWQHFPTGDAETGAIPTWGFGTVIESRCDGVDVGQRFYGYFPIADEVVLYPQDVSTAGFADGAEHRRGLPPVYAHYDLCTSDASYVAEREPQQALLRPLFSTAFLLDDFLYDNGYFGAQAVVLSSASSKTAYGTAFCLSRRQGDDVEVIGLTSPANADFTRSLGCYDEVVTYDRIDAALPENPSVYVDFSGSSPVRAAVHRRLGDQLTYDCAVGVTHWDAEAGRDAELPGPAPVLFFAPDQAAKRAEELGTAGLRERLATAWTAFMEPVTRAEDPWLSVVAGQGRSAVEDCYTALLDGRVPAREGHVLSV
ncbi:hypothetical protein CRI77_25890 [Mycolicibacterium duvalii]|uniref:Uncharacterized protein n=1 Tax=Mycolicibacterium duvalii TaxID=39688 RepID=A0A7I7K3T1_9MYCO|nr:DUF2855 family protein [Mycolicibacterium duvalii]MCV7367673.1 DUF2855 family protein [Mycolicibacterium duvalii]PEG35099.1 hypothetical protein CRI77_25890 [Mycolicibacterium duvalii]BBX18737.1 hypothetical protein MDUV_35970 [Mycolicibacterium duvalii]